MLYIIGVLVVLLTFVSYGVLSSKNIKMNYHEIDKDFSIKIAQISDTHFDDRYTYKQYEKMITGINENNPDIVFFTGDLFQLESIDETIEKEIKDLLSEIECTHKIAVLGNHDLREGDAYKETVIEILETSGFTVLQNESVKYTFNGTSYHFIGLDDLMTGDTNYTEILESMTEDDINIVLTHEPDTFDYIKEYNVEAVFCGHSHGGQIRLPIIGDIYNVPGAKKYNEHHYLINDIDLYISFGLGESVINMRFFNHRQFEIYDYS